MLELEKLIENKINKPDLDKYALIIGLTPSQGARSPKLWNRVYKKNNSKCRMYPADVESKNLKKLINYLKKDQYFLGGSVTAPYKNLIMKYLDHIDNDAKKIGSINTIKKNGNKIIGFNTDYHGALSTLKKINEKKKVLIIGAGGASKAVILSATKRFKNSNFYMFNRTPSKYKYLKKIFKSKKFVILKNYQEILYEKNFDLIINTSSVGFDAWIKKKNGYLNLKFFSPITKLNKIKLIKKKNFSLFIEKNKNLIRRDNENLREFFMNKKKLDIFDIIYKPAKTKLIKFYEKIHKKRSYNGLEMNLIQAVKAFMLVNEEKNLNKVKKQML